MRPGMPSGRKHFRRSRDAPKQKRHEPETIILDARERPWIRGVRRSRSAG